MTCPQGRHHTLWSYMLTMISWIVCNQEIGKGEGGERKREEEGGEGGRKRGRERKRERE